MHEVISKFVCA